MRDLVKVLICGDKGVGKSTFVNVLATGSFSMCLDDLSFDQSALPEIFLPSDLSEDGLDTLLWDSSINERYELVSYISEANVVLILYDTKGLDNLENLWLPLVRRYRKDVPVALIRNKIDLLDEENNFASEEKYSKLNLLKKKFKVQGLLDCSCKTQEGVEQTLMFSHMMVIFPIAPLQNIETSELKPLYKRALLRIFRIFDEDKDGLWSDRELKNFQKSCFETELWDSHILSIKMLLGESVKNGKVLFEGLCKMMVLFIERSQLFPVWRILEVFNFDHNLEQTLPKAIKGISAPYSKNDTDFTWQLSEDAVEYIGSLFDQFCGPDYFLDQNGENEVFKVADEPAVSPWNARRKYEFELCNAHSVPYFCNNSNSPQNLNKQQWISNWQMVAALNPALAEKYLIWLGFVELPEMGIRPSQPKKSIIKGCRNKFRDGKNSFFDNFGRYSYDYEAEIIQAFVFGRDEDLANMLHRTATKRKQSVKNMSEKLVRESPKLREPTCLSVPVEMDQSFVTFVFTFVPNMYQERYATFSTNCQALSRCDVAFILFDDNDLENISICLELDFKFPNNVPRLFSSISTKEVSLIESNEGFKLVCQHCKIRGIFGPISASFWPQLGQYALEPKRIDNLCTWLAIRLTHSDLRKELLPNDTFYYKLKEYFIILLAAATIVTFGVYKPFITERILSLFTKHQRSVLLSLSSLIAESFLFDEMHK